MKQARRFIVTGRVQGVFFRDSTRQLANKLNITGHAINRADGSVEVLAAGETAALRELAEWLHDGPPLATVTAVRTEAIDSIDPEGFRIG